MDDHRSMSPGSEPAIVLIDFDSLGEHPQDWKILRKWCCVLSIAISMLPIPLSSTIISPALGPITNELGGTSFSGPLALSIFLLTYCFGPLFFGPLSEAVGRWPVLHSGNLMYLIFNLAGGFSRSMPQLIIFRLFCGFGGGASLAVGASTVGDCFRPDERGQALAVISLVAVLGSCPGPIAGGFLTEYVSWRWTFYATSMLSVVCLVVSLIIGAETYPPVLLKHKKARIMKSMGLTDKSLLQTPYDKNDESISQLYKRTLSRPFYLLGTQPIVQVLALYYGFLFGLIYLLLASFSDLWTEKYGMSISIGSLNYVTLLVGYVLGSGFCAACTNKVFRVLKARNSGVERPELRLPLIIPASLLIPIGMFWYGWSAEYRLHWIVPDIGVALPMLGCEVVFQCTSAYLLDTFTIHAASAMGAVHVLRGLGAFGFPLFSPTMYRSLGYGWGNSVLGFAALAIGFPIPILLWRYGEKLRTASSFADRS